MPRRARRRSWGSVTEVQRGKRYIVRWMENTDAGRKRRSKTLRCTAAEASRFLAMKEVEHGTERRTPTFGEVYAMWYRPWLERRLEAGMIKPATFERYTEVWENVCAGRWGKVPVDRLRPNGFQSWLLEQNKGNAKLAVIVMRKMLDLAMRDGHVASNALRGDYDMPTVTTKSKPKGVYTLAEAMEGLEAVRGTSIEVPYILACFGGLRVGESCGVRTDDLGAGESDGVRFATVNVVRQMGYSGTEPVAENDLKTKLSVRTALVPEPYCDRLFAIAARREADGSGWMADRGDGLPMNKTTLAYRINKAFGERAIPPSNLRASWRTFGEFNWNIPYDTLEILMGHALKGVSGKHYIRPSIDVLMHSFAEPYRAQLDGS